MLPQVNGLHNRFISELKGLLFEVGVLCVLNLAVLELFGHSHSSQPALSWVGCVWALVLVDCSSSKGGTLEALKTYGDSKPPLTLRR